ncbi:hypothetical protein FALCPG4_007005 [Fusarium falciforme]
MSRISKHKKPQPLVLPLLLIYTHKDKGKAVLARLNNSQAFNSLVCPENVLLVSEIRAVEFSGTEDFLYHSKRAWNKYTA